MKKLFGIISLSLVFLTAGVRPAAARADGSPEDARLSSRLDRDSVLIGDRVKWSVQVNLKEGESFEFEKPAEPVAEGIETVSAFRVDTLRNRRGVLDVEGSMVLTSFDSGSFFLPPLAVNVTRGDGTRETLIYEGPTLEVTTVPVDTANFEMLDIKGQIKYPLTFAEMWPWLLGALLLGAGIFFLVRYIRYRRENRDFFGRPVVVDPPHIVALRSLEHIRNRKLWQNNKQKEFYSEVTDAIRQYIDGQYEVPAMEMTTSEIFDGLKGADIDPALLEKLQELFSTADYVKFAKHNASDMENEEAIPLAVRFVNTTYAAMLEKEKEAADAAGKETA